MAAGQGLHLSGDDGVLIYAPRGLAHGYLTLTDDARMVYFIDTPYAPSHAAGVRYDDPDLAIAWLARRREVVTDKDRAWPAVRRTLLP